MRAGFLRYLLITLLIFSVMEKTGISVLSLISTQGRELSETLYNDEEETSSRTESKEKVVSEFWLSHPVWLLPDPAFKAEPFTYARTDSDEHLAYFPSVPTPPPNTNIPA